MACYTTHDTTDVYCKFRLAHQVAMFCMSSIDLECHILNIGFDYSTVQHVWDTDNAQRTTRQPLPSHYLARVCEVPYVNSHVAPCNVEFRMDLLPYELMYLVSPVSRLPMATKSLFHRELIDLSTLAPLFLACPGNETVTASQ